MDDAIRKKEDTFQRKCWKGFLFAGVFLLVYNVPIFPFSSMHLVGFLSIAYLLIHIGCTINMIRNLKLGGFLLGIVAWFGYLLLVVVFLNQEDWHYTVKPLYILADVIPFGLATRAVFRRYKWPSEVLFNLFITAAVVQAILALAAFLIPEVQSYFLSKCIKAYGLDERAILASSKHRLYGFASWLAFDMPILQTIIALIVIHPSQKIKLSNCLIAFLLFFSAIINARNSIVVVAIGLFAMIILDRVPLKKRMKYAMKIVVMLITGVIVLLPVVRSLGGSTYQWIVQGLDEILNFLFKGDAGKTGENYFAYIVNPDVYRAPGGLLEVLVGVGHPTMGMSKKYGYGSDIGYTNDLWLGGLVYMIPLYLFFAGIMWLMRKHSDPRISFIGTFMLVMYPFVNIKGVAISTNAFTYFLCLLYIATVEEPVQSLEKYDLLKQN